MKFKNDRPTVITLPDARRLMPDEEFELDDGPLGFQHLACWELMKACWITPQDDESRAHIDSKLNADKSATAQRLAEIDKSPAFSKKAKEKARKNAESSAAAQEIVRAQPTGLEEARAAGQPVAGEPGHPQTPAPSAPPPAAEAAPVVVPPPPPAEQPAPAADAVVVPPPPAAS